MRISDWSSDVCSSDLIFSRTRDIIAANVTDLLDRAEDPEKMIRQIIFEMNETLVEVRASAARTIADQKEMRRHIAKLESLQDSWKEKAELALSKDREDLATAALVEKQKAGDMAADPEKMNRQSIFEMNEALVEVRPSAARTIAAQKEMRRHITKHESLQYSLKEKAELALSKDREDLATAARVEKQKAGDMAEKLKAEIAVLDDALTGYEGDIAKLQKKLSEARARQSSVVNRLESAENRYKLREMTNGDSVEDAFSRVEIHERRVAVAEGRADALGLGDRKSLDEEIAELQSADKDADELAALKAAQAKKQGAAPMEDII